MRGRGGSRGAQRSRIGPWNYPGRRRPGLRRRARPAARRDRLLAVARPPLRARRPRQPRPRLARHAAPAARPRQRRDLRARQPRLAPARRRRRRAAAASQRHARRHPRRARSRGLARLAAPAPHGGARAGLADAACRRRAAVGPGADARARAPSSSAALRERRPREFLAAMFGNEPLRWSDSLARRRAAALHPQHADAHPLRRRRRHARVRDQGRRRRRARRASTRGSTRRGGAPRARRSRSATGRRSAWSTAPTCSASTPAASGAAS